jgi:hypothetical protein
MSKKNNKNLSLLNMAVYLCPVFIIGACLEILNFPSALLFTVTELYLLISLAIYSIFLVMFFFKKDKFFVVFGASFLLASTFFIYKRSEMVKKVQILEKEIQEYEKEVKHKNSK